MQDTLKTNIFKTTMVHLSRSEVASLQVSTSDYFTGWNLELSYRKHQIRAKNNNNLHIFNMLIELFICIYIHLYFSTQFKDYL